MRPHPLERVLAPRAVAVVGACGDGTVGGIVLRNLVAAGPPGPVHAIGEGAARVPGVRAWRSLAEVEGDLDLAVLAAPPEALPGLVRACAERGVAGAIVTGSVEGAPSRGADDPRALRELLAHAAPCGLRLVGPNSVGLARPGAGLDATVTRGGAPSGTVALVAESGAVCAAALDWAAAHRVGFSAVVSLGDAVDVDFGEVLEHLAADGATRSILLHVESVRSARAFLTGLRLAARAKPVVVVKAGRDRGSAPGAHRDDVFDAALARTGAVRVASVEGMFAAAGLLATARAVSGNALAVVTNARGPALLAADRAAELGVTLPSLGEETRRALAAILPRGAAARNPVELPGDAEPASYASAVERCLGDRAVDAVLALLAPLALSRPAESADALVAAARGSEKPVIACLMGEALVREARARLVAAGLPTFAAPEAAVEAFGLLASHARAQRLLRQVPAPLAPDAAPRLDRAREIVEGALARGRRRLGTAELARLLATVGVRDRAAAGRRVRGAERSVAVARDPVFGPVVRFGRTPAGEPGEAAVALPPLDTALLRTLVATSPGAAAFAAGLSAAEVAAFERLLWAISELVSELPQIRALEIDPVVLAESGVWAGNASVELAPPDPAAGRYGHMAIHPYPRDLGERWRLPDGAVVTVRPIRPEDAELEASFVRNLSDAARHARFMTGVRELTREMLIRFTQLDYDRELALVALVEQGGRETQIAVARYVKADAERAQISMVVADEWQRRGIGVRLLGALLGAARARGVRRAEGEVLAENVAIRSLVAKLGFSIRRDRERPEVLLVEKALDAGG